MPGKHRALQVAPTRRKLFTPAMKQTFLEWLAATCNVSLAARKTGIHYRTACRHRGEDPRFAQGWARALSWGTARLRARLIETRRQELPIGIEGDWDAPEMDDIDPGLALQLLREHGAWLAGERKPGPRPRVATNEEVRAALVKRIRAVEARQRAERRLAAEAEGGPVGNEPARARPAPRAGAAVRKRMGTVKKRRGQPADRVSAGLGRRAGRR